MRIRHPAVRLVIASGVLLLSACGDDNDVALPTPTATFGPAPATTPTTPSVAPTTPSLAPTTPPGANTPTSGPPVPTSTPTRTGGPTRTINFTCHVGSDSSIEICTELACPIASRPVTAAEIEFDCDGIQCTARLLRFDPVSIDGIGLVCVAPIDASVLSCPIGLVNCQANGPPFDLDLEQNRNIGECGVRNDPNDTTGNSDCQAECEKQCDGRLVADSGCDGYCDGGTRNTQRCNCDRVGPLCQGMECPGGSCNGRDDAPPEDRNVCGCQCLDVGGAPSRAGAVYAQIAAQIIVETTSDHVCGEGPILLTLPPQCIALTTERASGRLLNANNNATGVQIPPTGKLEDQGAPLTCERMENGDVDGLNIVSNISFFGSTLGDLEVQLDWVCR